jgi:cytochrome c oxidase assembly protein subunit 15
MTPLLQRWILLCAALVVGMVLIGGLTRLTESGLSIVEWKLFSGIFPPMSEQGWAKEFARYQTSPEFKQVNRGFSVADFQRIFWLEYIHRVLGRVIGLALVLPFFYFLARRAMPGWLAWRMAFACVLVAAQGTVGWIMVASGLKHEPRVDAVKLALHLSLALALYGLLLWTRWQLRAKPRPTASAFPTGWRILALLACVQIVFGALVAGLDAGLSYNSFPLMDGHLLPSGLHRLQPWWLNHVENVLTVQFQHRALAYGVALLALGLSAAAWRRATLKQKRAIRWLVAIVLVQFGLGVATLLTGVNLALASAHQLGAVALLSILLRFIWLFPYRKSAF